MSIKSKVLAVAATMTMVGGVSAVGLLPADASTGPCGKACLSVFSQEFGSGFVLDVLRQGEKAGQPIILFRTSNSDPAEDFTILDQGTVADYYASGLVSEALNNTYAADEGYEVEYSPYGVDSGLCIGVGSTAGDGTPVALEPCGSSSKTVWVVDSTDSNGPDYPWINGSDTNFADPYVLHYPGNGYPTDAPRPRLNTHSLQQYSTSPATVYNNELWDGLAPAPTITVLG
jgi:hypothetical protein